MLITEPCLKRRGNDSPISVAVTYKNDYMRAYNEGTPWKEFDMTVYSSVSEAYYEGWDIPSYHKRLRAGELLPFTPWKKYSISGSASKGEYDYRYSSGGTHHVYVSPPDRHYGFDPATWQITLAALEAQLRSDNVKYVTNAAAKMYSKGFDALTWLAELKDVKRLWTSISEKLISLKNPRKLVGKYLGKGAFKRSTRDASSDWLEYRYGWSQFVRDYKSFREAVELLNGAHRRHSERTGFKQSFSTSTTSNPAPTHPHFDFRLVIVENVTTEVRGVVAADLEVPAFQFNLLQTGWEIIPYSFVVDWFVNVGKTLSAISFLADVKCYSASWGQKTTINRSTHFYPVSTKSGYLSGNVESMYTSVGELEIRQPCSVPYFPHFALNMNTTKGTDALALIIQRLK